MPVRTQLPIWSGSRAPQARFGTSDGAKPPWRTTTHQERCGAPNRPPGHGTKFHVTRSIGKGVGLPVANPTAASTSLASVEADLAVGQVCGLVAGVVDTAV